MIRVRVLKDEDGCYRSFSCKGHADYARKGRDIICSAVSVLVVNTVNSLEAISGDSIRVSDRDGFVECEFTDKPTEIGKAFVDSLVMGIRGLVEEYGTDYLSLEVSVLV